jgi:hypothetical protein
VHPVNAVFENVGAGLPVATTGKLNAAPTVAVVLVPLVMVGAVPVDAAVIKNGLENTCGSVKLL